MDVYGDEDNCGIYGIGGFQDVHHSFKELAADILSFDSYTFESSRKLPFAIMKFSANWDQRFKVARWVSWLEGHGERVHKTRWVTNPNSRNRIKAFLWVPSSRFKRELLKEMRKQCPADRRW